MNGWKVAKVLQGSLEARVAKSLLEASGIKVHLQGEAVGALYGLQTGPLAEIVLMVPAKDYERAQEILRGSAV